MENTHLAISVAAYMSCVHFIYILRRIFHIGVSIYAVGMVYQHLYVIGHDIRSYTTLVIVVYARANMPEGWRGDTLSEAETRSVSTDRGPGQTGVVGMLSTCPQPR